MTGAIKEDVGLARRQAPYETHISELVTEVSHIYRLQRGVYVA